jgi:large subunit ribosomal protein L24
MKIRKGDQVKIIAGNDKGKTGKVLSVMKDAGRIVVEGANIRKKHVRTRRQGKKGEIVHVPAAIMASRVMLICPNCSRSTRIRHGIEDGRKMRVCKKCGAEV